MASNCKPSENSGHAFARGIIDDEARRLILHPRFRKMRYSSAVLVSQRLTRTAKSNAMQTHPELFEPGWEATFPGFVATTHDRGTITARPETRAPDAAPPPALPVFL